MRNTGFLALLCAFALIFSAAAFAKAKNEGSFELTQAARVGSTQLQPGHYKAEWTGTSGTVEVAIQQHGKTIATTKAELKELATPSAYSAVTVRNAPDHHARVDEIQFNNRKDALVLSRPAAS
jgi:hypothetical protein